VATSMAAAVDIAVIVEVTSLTHDIIASFSLLK
jgi:hypothetical protein